ncbi:hypothetical protein ACQJBY_038787 [Aegilops geniculata]
MGVLAAAVDLDAGDICSISLPSGCRPTTNPSLAVSIGIQPLLSVLGQGIWGSCCRGGPRRRRHLQHLPPVGLQDLYAQEIGHEQPQSIMVVWQNTEGREAGLGCEVEI